jgi:hypothetical protein
MVAAIGSRITPAQTLYATPQFNPKIQGQNEQKVAVLPFAVALGWMTSHSWWLVPAAWGAVASIGAVGTAMNLDTIKKTLYDIFSGNGGNDETTSKIRQSILSNPNAKSMPESVRKIAEEDNISKNAAAPMRIEEDKSGLNDSQPTTSGLPFLRRNGRGGNKPPKKPEPPTKVIAPETRQYLEELVELDAKLTELNNVRKPLETKEQPLPEQGYKASTQPFRFLNEGPAQYLKRLLDFRNLQESAISGFYKTINYKGGLKQLNKDIKAVRRELMTPEQRSAADALSAKRSKSMKKNLRS